MLLNRLPNRIVFSFGLMTLIFFCFFFLFWLQVCVPVWFHYYTTFREVGFRMNDETLGLRYWDECERVSETERQSIIRADTPVDNLVSFKHTYRLIICTIDVWNHRQSNNQLLSSCRSAAETTSHNTVCICTTDIVQTLVRFVLMTRRALMDIDDQCGCVPRTGHNIFFWNRNAIENEVESSSH